MTPSNSPASTRSPVSQRATPSRPVVEPRRKPLGGVGYAGYNRGAAARSNVGIEDWHEKLAQMKREVAQIKADESQARWNMKREEDRARNMEMKQDAKDYMNWRQDQAMETKECAAERDMANKDFYLKCSLEYQEFKRAAHQNQKEEDIHRNKEDYLESKDNSQWYMDLKKTLPAEERKMIIDMNLERYALMAESRTEETQRKQLEQRMEMEQAEQDELSYQMLQVQKERDAALHTLEFIRQQRVLAIPEDRDIPARPYYVKNNRPL